MYNSWTLFIILKTQFNLFQKKYNEEEIANNKNGKIFIGINLKIKFRFILRNSLIGID